jgi:hypothetical protein
MDGQFMVALIRSKYPSYQIKVVTEVSGLNGTAYIDYFPTVRPFRVREVCSSLSFTFFLIRRVTEAIS